MGLSRAFSVKRIFEIMEANRNGFYMWKKCLEHFLEKAFTLANYVMLFKRYYAQYLSYGYRLLNARIRLDLGQVMSDSYARKCCKIAGITSQSKHYR